MLPYSEWLDYAEQLREGESRRHQHICGPGNTLLVTHDHKGYSAFCFRCNDNGFKAHGVRTVEQLIAAKESRAYVSEQAASRVLRLPEDYSDDIPRIGRMWYWRAGITDDVGALYRFGWSDRQQRVVIPVYDRTSYHLVAVQSRAVRQGQQPKYLNVSASNRTGAAFFSDPRTLGYYGPAAPDTPGSRIVLCEDILSSIRVGMSVQSGSILGTRLDDALAAKLCKYDRVTFWLDGDKAGIKGRLHGLRTLGLVHKGQVDYIESPNDPKCYSQEEIRQWLKT